MIPPTALLPSASRRLLLGAGAAAWLLGACAGAGAGSDPGAAIPDAASAPPADLAPSADDGPPAAIASMHVTVRLSTDSVVTGVIDVAQSHVAHFVVRYGTTTAYGTETPVTTIPGGTPALVSVPVFGLDPVTTYHFAVHAVDVGGASIDSPDLVLTTGSLPDELPRPQVTVAGSAAGGGLVLIGLTNGFNMVVDRTGRVMWYRRIGPSAADFARQPNGHLTMFDSTNAAVVETDVMDLEYATWRAAPGGILDGHDFEISAAADGWHGLFIADEPTLIDTTHLTQNGAPDQMATGNTLEEMDGTGNLVWELPLGQIVGLDESHIDFSQQPLDPFHANAIDVLSDNALLVSLRHTDTVYKIDRGTSRILWRLGGTKSDYAFTGDPLGGFCYQHDARMLENGDVMVFDNGNCHELQASRAAEYRLDAATHKATLVWSYRYAPDRFCAYGGSARRLPNGHTLLGCSTALSVTDVDAGGAVTWEMTLGGTDASLYRAVPVDSLWP